MAADKTGDQPRSRFRRSRVRKSRDRSFSSLTSPGRDTSPSRSRSAGQRPSRSRSTPCSAAALRRPWPGKFPSRYSSDAAEIEKSENLPIGMFFEELSIRNGS